jgi:hypothetical protein
MAKEILLVSELIGVAGGFLVGFLFVAVGEDDGLTGEDEDLENAVCEGVGLVPIEAVSREPLDEVVEVLAVAQAIDGRGREDGGSEREGDGFEIAGLKVDRHGGSVGRGCPGIEGVWAGVKRCIS